MPTINIDQRKINYSARGKGKVIVLLHGFCEDHSVWDEFISSFTKYKIIRIDLPGFGRSEPLENISIEKMADDIKAVLDALKVKTCTLIGHSMGGYVGLAFAKKYESMLIGLGLFHSHPYADSEDKKANRNKSIQFIKKNGHILFVKQLVPKLFATSFLSSNRFLNNKLIYQASRYSPEGILAGLEAMRDRPDNSTVLANIKCPVLFIVGREDALVPWQYSTEQTALPEIADIHILEGVGHMGMFEAKKDTQKSIKRFMQYCVDLQKEITRKANKV